MTNASKGSKHLIIFACMLLQAIPYGIAQNIPPLFIHYLEKEYHFSVESVGYIFMIGALAASLISPMAGKMYSKFPVKLMMLGGLILSACGVMLNAISTKLWMFLVASAITQMGTVTFSGLGVPFLIATWFDKKSKASALGIAFAGGSIGNFFLQPIVTHLLNHYELHRVYFMCALASLIVGVLIGVFFIHPNKQPLSSTKNTFSNKQSSSSTTNTQPTNDTHPANIQSGIGYKQTTHQKSFWALSCFYLIIGLAISALSSQYANFFAAIHINTTLIGTIGSTFAIACLVGNVGGGFLFSKIGVRNAMFLAFILQLVTVILLIASIFIPAIKIFSAFAWALLYGFNVYSYMSAPAVMMQTLFGMKDTSQILGVFSIFFAVGFALGNIVFGFFVDTFGFTAAWISILCYVVIGFSGLLFFITDIQKHQFAEQTA